jgi:hypothetical protein
MDEKPEAKRPEPKPPEPRRRAAPDPRSFFVVWSPEGGDPVVRHPSFNVARSVAWKLSEKYPGQSFYVLRSCWGRPARAAEHPAVAGEVAQDGGPVEPAP